MIKPLDKSILVNCPICEYQFSYYTSKFRPFCSEKCKMIDLGQWLREDYRVAGREAIVEQIEDEDVEQNEEDND